MLADKLSPAWHNALGLEDSYYTELESFLEIERKEFKIYPEQKDLFKAFDFCDFSKVRVVILGQDPYHGPGQAMGLSFSVPRGNKIPPSLRNIYKELDSDLQISPAMDGDLSHWAEQGVLLLNTSLSVRDSEPGSHSKGLWEKFSAQVLQSLSDQRKDLVFVLWGAHAQGHRELLDEQNHLIIESAHPSPFSAHRGFFGSKPFSQINQHLELSGQKPIDWRLEQLLF
ncbi:uracil-DNA glycosylase [Lentisphaera profundi]|uniref:Uracil-DNA glycosylase n=1 Tax=Lentisphaera profundi TaxID=1658616 RepID=A0ABY7VW92_9BACT|nr:uracil-DNA glycosylase [Lentisphaera profundi]WDE98357.1 uracil-DNA glycosylase [Lentisphaera profundi]